MLHEVRPLEVPGLVKFSSMDALRAFLKELMIQYEKESARYGEEVGRLMRILEKEMEGKDIKKLREVGWRPKGMLMVNMSEPTRGTLELMIEAMEDYKTKAKRTADVLTKIGELENVFAPYGASLLLYLRYGVPLRLVIDGKRTPEVDQLVPTTA
jgi:radical SAM superfamily enzyme YgiQ (UPF0313 family)